MQLRYKRHYICWTTMYFEISAYWWFIYTWLIHRALFFASCCLRFFFIFTKFAVRSLFECVAIVVVICIL